MHLTVLHFPSHGAVPLDKEPSFEMDCENTHFFAVAGTVSTAMSEILELY